MKTKFQAGDWVIAGGGIGQVTSSEQVYSEEFDMENARSIGNPVKVYVFYKLLCDFGGKLRKRNRFQMVREKSCKKLRVKDAKLIAQIKSSTPEDFAKFEEASETIGILHGFEYRIPEDQLESTIERIQEAIRCLPVPFTYPQFIDECKRQGLDPIGEIAEPVKRNLMIQLNNAGAKTRDKRRLFTQARVFKIKPAI